MPKTKKRRHKLDAAIRWREHKSQADFSRKKDFSIGYISGVVSGRIYPGREGLHRLAAALDLTIPELKKLL
jgi:transcriptional regulator with XRE-family HTH domain